jgi:4-amino-4-deoxy-L-arabinose transferase-like glycosyltransferase
VRRLPRLPRALAALLGATALLGVTWSLVTPPFQTPDENWHVAYLQTVAEQGKLPGLANRPVFSTEQQLALDADNAEQTQQVLATEPEWSSEAYRRFRERSERMPDSARKDGGGVNFAQSNPPLFYVLETVPYKLASGGDLFARLSAARLLSVVFLVWTVAATWLLAGTVFGPRRDLQLAAAAIPALLPMVTFISSSITPDALLYPLWTTAFWLGARLLKRQGGALDAVALVAVTGLAIATKSPSYALVPGVLLVLGVSLWRIRHRRRLVAALAVGGVLAFGATAGTWFVVARSSDRPIAAQLTDALEGTSEVNEREFLSYVWQYYLPRLPFQATYPGLESWKPPKAYETWFRQSMGAFGWLEVRWPNRAYWPMAIFCLAVLGGALVALWRRRRSLDLPVLAFLGVTAFALVIGLHWTEYRLAEQNGALINQGRYLFPLVGLGGLIFAAALTSVPERLRQPALAVSVGLLAVLQLFSIALVAERFYA